MRKIKLLTFLVLFGALLSLGVQAQALTGTLDTIGSTFSGMFDAFTGPNSVAWQKVLLMAATFAILYGTFLEFTARKGAGGERHRGRAFIISASISALAWAFVPSAFIAQIFTLWNGLLSVILMLAVPAILTLLTIKGFTTWKKHHILAGLGLLVAWLIAAAIDQALKRSAGSYLTGSAGPVFETASGLSALLILAGIIASLILLFSGLFTGDGSPSGGGGKFFKWLWPFGGGGDDGDGGDGSGGDSSPGAGSTTPGGGGTPPGVISGEAEEIEEAEEAEEDLEAIEEAEDREARDELREIEKLRKELEALRQQLAELEDYEENVDQHTKRITSWSRTIYQDPNLTEDKRKEVAEYLKTQIQTMVGNIEKALKRIEKTFKKVKHGIKDLDKKHQTTDKLFNSYQQTLKQIEQGIWQAGKSDWDHQVDQTALANVKNWRDQVRKAWVSYEQTYNQFKEELETALGQSKTISHFEKRVAKFEKKYDDTTLENLHGVHKEIMDETRSLVNLFAKTQNMTRQLEDSRQRLDATYKESLEESKKEFKALKARHSEKLKNIGSGA